MDLEKQLAGSGMRAPIGDKMPEGLDAASRNPQLLIPGVCSREINFL